MNEIILIIILTSPTIALLIWLLVNEIKDKRKELKEMDNMEYHHYYYAFNKGNSRLYRDGKLFTGSIFYWDRENKKGKKTK